ncbi:MAG: DUF3180 domain-containing protein [Actinobacteria bacterium]|nr:DUF3180 domain-containing protein [Actinomycetota bacterium]NBY14866.1 DUF3180 domain-containing protein [Actinomycetota bacterium]
MKLDRTRPSFLVALAVLASALGWSIGRLWPHWFMVQLSVPWINAVTMWFLAITLLAWTLIARPKLQRKKIGPRLPPIVAARTAALAMSTSRVGSLVFGFYTGLLILNLGLTRTSEVGYRISIIGLILVAAAILVITALWLERMCEVNDKNADGPDQVTV